ncbi:MAG: cadherin-like domain-containing protein [Planctomycetes bacterium]|nr:cadherin-like domain-containing protein [Planctomycetota bacterium]
MRKVLILSTLALCTLSSGCCFWRGSQTVRLSDDEAFSCGATAVTIDVLDNDRIPDRYTVDSVTIPTPPAASVGTATVNGNSVVFTPAVGASGAISFNYQVNYHLTSDPADVSESEAKITITIIASAQAPVAGADTASTAFNEAVLIDVLDNDSDPDIAGGGAQSLTVSNLTTPANGGTVEQVGNQVRYTPAQDFDGSDSFQYTVTDACGASAVGTVTVTVLPAPPPPPPSPAKVLLSNQSDFEITVFIGGVEIDTVQPHGSTPLPLDVAAGDNQEVRVEALVVSGDPPRVTNNIAKFASDVSYTITYTDDNTNPPTIGVEITP